MDGPFRVGVDIGGTFTDLLAMDEHSGRTFVLKQPSTASPVDAVVEGIRELAQRRAALECRLSAAMIKGAQRHSPIYGDDSHCLQG